MEKYLYLSCKEWACPWIDGGEVPIFLASKYLRQEHVGFKTADENFIDASIYPVPKPMKHGFNIEDVKNFNMTDCYANGSKLPNLKSSNYYKQDGLILSFSHIFRKEIAFKLGKLACVKIKNIERLKETIDKQLGVKGVMCKCLYTRSSQRNHFLKPKEDEWQREFRIFWNVTEPGMAMLPKGIATLISKF